MHHSDSSTRRRFLLNNSRIALAVAAHSAGVSVAWAQSDYPTRPIRVIVPFGPGSATDIMTRHIGPHMSNTLGQNLIVDNRAGANGVVGSHTVKEAPPDGYMLVMGATSSHSIMAAMRPKTLPYDIQKDFTAIGRAATSANIISVHPSLPVRNLQELVAYAKTQPKGLSFASSPVGSSNNLAGEMLRLQGVNLVSVPYNNIGQGISDVIAGHVPILIYTVAVLPHVREGRLRAIATLSEKRLQQAPELPTAVEQGMPDMVANAWFGLFGPAQLPHPIRDKISAALRDAINDPAINARLVDTGLVPSYLSPAETDAFVARDIAMWKDVVARAGIKTGE